MSDRALLHGTIDGASLLPAGAIGIDAGLTLTKCARATGDRVELTAFETARVLSGEIALDTDGGARSIGVTGARAAQVAGGTRANVAPEIDAGARGAIALMRTATDAPVDAFVLALLGTGTPFAAVRDGVVTHLGGTALGGGSFAGIARRVDSTLTYDAMIERASRGDRRNADVMIADAYADGIGRLAGDLTAAHVAKHGDFSLDDFLAGLLNLHGESLAQIAASRARIAGIDEVVLAGGFVHGNDALVASITAMCGMFGIGVRVAPMPGYAGAVGAALMAVEQSKTEAR